MRQIHQRKRPFMAETQRVGGVTVRKLSPAEISDWYDQVDRAKAQRIREERRQHRLMPVLVVASMRAVR